MLIRKILQSVILIVSIAGLANAMNNIEINFFNKVMEEITTSFSKGEIEQARTKCKEVIGNQDFPSVLKSYSALLLAKSFLSEGNILTAKNLLQEIIDNRQYPQIHRFEAEKILSELNRASSFETKKYAIKHEKEFDIKIYVSSRGSDEKGDGSKKKPFATIYKAVEELRKIKSPDKSAIIVIGKGIYKMDKSLILDERDSGSEKKPVVFRAQDKEGCVFYGGFQLTEYETVKDEKILNILPEQAKGKVIQFDLKKLGITNYGELKVRGFGQPMPYPATIELYFNGRPMTLARWPNEGFAIVKKVIDPGSLKEKRPSVFEYDSDKPSRWLKAEDAWLFGYFRYLWADGTLKIGKIDPEKKTITTAQPYNYAGEGMAGQPIIYYAFNLLEELDTPGEWYLDRKKGILYFWPPENPEKAKIEISVLDRPMLVMKNVSNVIFERIIFDMGMHDGIQVENCNNILFAGCTISRMAGNGVVITGGCHNGILSCDIHTIGRTAIEITGGERETLTPATHFVENCHIYSFGRIDRTYTPGVVVNGVGNIVSHNLMHDCPSSAMRIEGNNHLIEFNEVHTVVTESDDQGAVDMWGNPVYRGNVFRYNYFHDIGKIGKEPFLTGMAGIRLDDAISGQVLYGNIFENCSKGYFGGVQIHAGRDNILDSNIFVNCSIGISGGWNPKNIVWKWYKEGQRSDYHNTKTYLSSYSELKNMFDDRGVNYAFRNIFVNSSKAFASPEKFVMFANLLDVESVKYIGFHPILLEKIGLYQDEFRKIERSKDSLKEKIKTFLQKTPSLLYLFR